MKLMHAIGRILFANGIVLATASVIEPGSQPLEAALAGLLVGIGAWGWE